jgi:hypothetical protein
MEFRPLDHKGFSLLEVMIVAGLMMIVSLGAAQFITSQGQQISAMEDRLSRLHLGEEVERIFSQRELCRALLRRSAVPKNQEPVSLRIEDDLGRVIFNPKLEDNIYDHLRITDAQFRNLSVTGPNSVGDLQILLTLERLRQGGSNPELTPVNFRLPVVVDSNSLVKSCYPKRAPICGDSILLKSGQWPDPSKDFRNCCRGGGALSDCITTGITPTPGGSSIFYICTCE